jgi:hypothetical protein
MLVEDMFVNNEYGELESFASFSRPEEHSVLLAYASAW